MIRRLIFTISVLANVLALSPQVAGQTCGPTRVELAAEICTPFGEILTAEIWLRDPNLPVVGGQFNVEYSFTNYILIGFEAGEEPISSLLYFDEPSPGFIRIAVGALFGAAESEIILAKLTFYVLDDAGKPFVRFHLGGPPRNLLSAQGGSEIVPILRNSTVNDQTLHDFADFQNCFSGDGAAAPTDCACVFDMDHDSDIDEIDWRLMDEGVIGPSGMSCQP